MVELRGVATTPVLTVTSPVSTGSLSTPLAATAVNDGSGDLLVMISIAVEGRAALELYRVSGCQLDLAF